MNNDTEQQRARTDAIAAAKASNLGGGRAARSFRRARCPHAARGKFHFARYDRRDSCSRIYYSEYDSVARARRKFHYPVRERRDRSRDPRPKDAPAFARLQLHTVAVAAVAPVEHRIASEFASYVRRKFQCEEVTGETDRRRAAGRERGAFFARPRNLRGVSTSARAKMRETRRRASAVSSVFLRALCRLFLRFVVRNAISILRQRGRRRLRVKREHVSTSLLIFLRIDHVPFEADVRHIRRGS